MAIPLSFILSGASTTLKKSVVTKTVLSFASLFLKQVLILEYVHIYSQVYCDAL